MELIHGTEEKFKDLIQDELVLVDFFATWCGPCKMLSPILEELSNERSDIKIIKMDVDSCPTLSKEYGIMSVPTLMLFKHGEIVSKEHGFMPKQALETWISNYR